MVIFIRASANAILRDSLVALVTEILRNALPTGVRAPYRDNENIGLTHAAHGGIVIVEGVLAEKADQLVLLKLAFFAPQWAEKALSTLVGEDGLIESLRTRGGLFCGDAHTRLGVKVLESMTDALPI